MAASKPVLKNESPVRNHGTEPPFGASLAILSLRCTFDRVRKTNGGQALGDSRSTTLPPLLNLIHRDPRRATPGYIFVSPTFSGQYRPDSGPYIFDTINGTLIWSGITATGAADHTNVQGLHLCQYQDSPHLCFWRGQQRDANGVGIGVIMSQDYTVVQTVSSTSSLGGVDLHEFHLTPDNTAMITTYQPRFIDGLWVLDSCFEEVPVDSGAREQAVFKWCASNHISLNENPHRKDLSSTHKGKTPDRAWDYVHLNSVAKSPAGDYLVSARHLNCIMLVSGVDGHILWRLGGGKTSNFTLDGDVHFARQHDARFISGLGIGSGLTTISLFNNRNDGVDLRKHPSGGLILELDHARATARRVSDYGRITVPKSESGNRKAKEYISANGMGNLQTLPNGHVLANFGQHAAMAEYPPEGGDPMFYANFLPLSDSHSASPSEWKATNYRAFLYPFDTNGQSQWIGQPTTPPDLWTYARTPTSPQSFYVSWNGDTRTAQYRFWVSDDNPCLASSSPEPCNNNNPSQAPADETFQQAGSWPRDRASFETNFTAQGTSHPWSFVEALDAAGVSLANSSKVRTYMPPEEDRRTCGELHCFPMHLRAEDLVPLDEFSTAMGLGSGEGEGKGAGGHWVLGLLEHVFALVGLGLCAWWVLGRACNRWRDMRKEYGPVGVTRDESRMMIARGHYSGVDQRRLHA